MSFVSHYQSVSVNSRGSIIESSNYEKFLGIYLDSNFSFEYHINKICHKASQRHDALSRTDKYIFKDKRSMLLKSFIIAQFNYFPTVWICLDRGLNRALRIVYKDKKIQFQDGIKT